MVRVAPAEEDARSNLHRLRLLALLQVHADRVQVERRARIVRGDQVRAFVGPYHAHQDDAAVREHDAVARRDQQAIVPSVEQ